MTNNLFFSKNTPSSFYWAGFIAADGCVGDIKSHGGKYIYKYLSIHLSDLDTSHLNKFKKAISFSSNVSCYKNECKITILSFQIVEDLKRFNIIPRKTLKYIFPEWVVDHKFCNHYMRGYFDGDGTVCTQTMKESNTSQLRFSLVGTKNFLEVYQKILINSCNIKTNRKIIPMGRVYVLQYGGNKISSSIYKYLYSESDNKIRLSRKYKIVDKQYI